MRLARVLRLGWVGQVVSVGLVARVMRGMRTVRAMRAVRMLRAVREVRTLRAARAMPLALVVLAGLHLNAGLGQAAPTIHLVDDRGRALELPAPPRRIVSLLPSLTETLCELGACARLVGTDRYSNWPAQVRGLPKLGGLEDAQLERIVALKPDLVLVANSPRLIERLEAMKLPVMMLIPDSFDDARRVALVLATALGDAPAGAQLWQRLEARIAAAAARVPPALRGQRVYLEVASAPYAAGEASFVGELLKRLALTNIVPAAMGPFPRLNPEYVLRAQPDIVIASESALTEMPSRPGWAGLRALREQRHCGIAAEPWDSLVRSGPRLADGADAIVLCLQRIAEAVR